MKGKIFSSILGLVLITAILSVFASAAVDFTVSPSKLAFTVGDSSVDFIITNVGDAASFTIPSAIITSGSDSLPVTFSNTSFSLPTSGSKTITATVSSSILSGFESGTYNTTISITAVNETNSSSKSLTLEASRSFCEAGDIGKLDIKGIDFTVNGFGDDNDWYLLDEIEVSVDVKNTGNDDIDNVVLSWALVDKDTGETIIDDEENDVDIKDGDTETYTFTFTLSPNDFDTDTLKDNLVFMVKAYSDDVGEDVQCVSEDTDINLQASDHFVVLDNIQAPETVACGASFQLTANAWNIGDDDEQDVEVRVFNSDLKIDQKVKVGDIDQLDEQKITANLQIPQNLTEKTYSLRLEVLDDNSDVFENDDNDAAEYSVQIMVSGSCKATTTPSDVTLTTSLESEAKAGAELTIKTTLRNTGTAQTLYSMQTSGQDSWSTGLRLSQSQVILAAGESKDILIYLTPNKDVSGDNQLIITASFDGKTKTQNVVVNVAKSTGFNFSLGGSWYLWLIIGINVILIVVIIIVAVMMSRK